MGKYLWPAVLALIALVLAGHLISAWDGHRVQVWEDSVKVSKAHADSALQVASAALAAKAQADTQSAKLAVTVKAREQTIKDLKAKAAAMPVPEDCAPIVAIKDSIIATQDSTVNDLKTSFERQKQVSANLATALTASNQALQEAQHVIDKAPIHRPFILRLLPHVTVGATAGVGMKGPDVVVGIGAGWDL